LEDELQVNILDKIEICESNIRSYVLVRIHFLDNSSKIFLVEAFNTAKDIITLVLEKFEVDHRNIDYVLPYYALYESKDGNNIDGNLNQDAIVLNVTRSWGQDCPDAKLLFMIRLYLPSINGLQFGDVVSRRLGLVNGDSRDYYASMTMDTYIANAEIVDPNLLHLQYIQAVYNVITGAYPTTEDEALTLGSLHFLLKFGEYKSAIHVKGFLENRIVEFIPIRLLKKTKKSMDDWEADLLLTVRGLMSEMPNLANADEQARIIEWQHRYLSIIYRMPLYGCSFFRCNQRATRYTPDNPVLGIHQLGIIILDKQRNIHKQYHMAEISEWGYKPDVMFNFQVKSSGELEAFIEFSTVEGKTISDLLTDYALAYIKERDSEELRSRGAVPQRPKTVPIATNAPKSSMTRSPSMRNPSSNKNKAAIKIQALVRGFLLRIKWLRADCAILIQATFRGYSTRLKVGLMIAELMERGDLEIDGN
jgi:hypothetical protein